MTQQRRKYRPRQQTQGIKGAKMPRINMAFDRDVYDYIRGEADREHTTMTRIVNAAIRDRMEPEEAGDE